MGAMPSDYVKEAMMDRKHRRREREERGARGLIEFGSDVLTKGSLV